MLALLPVIAFLRLTTMSNTLCDPDLGTPAYASSLFLEGRCAYSDAVVTKPPGTLALYAASFALFGRDMRPIYALATLFAWASCALLYRILAMTIHRAAGVVAAILYAMYQAEMVSAGTCPNFEFWTIAPSLVALLALSVPPCARRHVLAGMAMAVAIAMKQSALFFAIACAIEIALRRSTGARWSPASSARALSQFALGAVIGAAPFVAMLAVTGCIGTAADQLNPFGMFGYRTGADWTTTSRLVANQWLRLWRSSPALLTASVASVAMLIAAPSWRNSAAPVRAWMLYALAALVSLLMGGHWYGHYFVVLFPAACLMVAAGLTPIALARPRRIRIAMCVVVFALVSFDMRTELSWATLSARGLEKESTPFTAEIARRNRDFVFERAAHNQVANHLEWQPTLAAAAEFVRPRLAPGDTIWTYDYLPEMYLFLDAFAPTRHQENFEIVAADDLSHTLHNYGLWHVRTDVDVLRTRADLLASFANSPPRYVFRYAQDCRRHAPFPGRGRVPPSWPYNIWGDPMAHCPPRVETFAELDAFLRANYRITPWAWDTVISIYELGETTASP
ncbi:MAG: glycosyltransferase family 39 protein [Deltaproteobacteria bacterium]|nr:glycosyltransferase family 39 protein [Deltaproteobacteria bacterium]